jgi:diguanylate cyclase (GGDEF)-like protein
MALSRFPAHLTLIGRADATGNLAERRDDAGAPPIPFPAARSSFDALCRVASRRALLARLETVGELAPNAPLSFLVVKVDGLRAFNESAGREAGDGALKTVAAEIRELIRATDLAGRLSGATFGIVLQGTGATAASAVAARLSHRLNQLLGAASPVGVRVSAATGLGLHFETLPVAAMDSFSEPA